MINESLSKNNKKTNNIVEGTSGSTGIALASLCKALKLQLHIVMPDDQADEKKKLLESKEETIKYLQSLKK